MKAELRALLDSLGPEEEAVAVFLLRALQRSRGSPPASMGLVGELTGATLATEEPGRVVYRLEAHPHLHNPYGVLAGPVLYTVMDYSMGRALRTLAAQGELAATVEMKVNYLRPVRAGTVTVETQVLHQGSALAVLESRARSQEGALVALAVGTYRLFPAAAAT